MELVSVAIFDVWGWRVKRPYESLAGVVSLQDCGADCAKFQKSELEHKFNRRALGRPYISKHSWGRTYGEHKRHLEFSHDQYRELQRYAKEIGIFFTASGMDEVRVVNLEFGV